MTPRERVEAWLAEWSDYRAFIWDGVEITLYYPGSREPWGLTEYRAGSPRRRALQQLAASLAGTTPLAAHKIENAWQFTGGGASEQMPPVMPEVTGDARSGIKLIALRHLLTGDTANPGDAYGECAGCSFATVDPAAEYPPNPSDPGEGYYNCSLLQRQHIWGERPPCTIEDWQRRAREELIAATGVKII